MISSTIVNLNAIQSKKENEGFCMISIVET